MWRATPEKVCDRVGVRISLGFDFPGTFPAGPRRPERNSPARHRDHGVRGLGSGRDVADRRINMAASPCGRAKVLPVAKRIACSDTCAGPKKDKTT
jgi:hypothetical protein